VTNVKYRTGDGFSAATVNKRIQASQHTPNAMANRIVAIQYDRRLRIDLGIS
jgi:hypothetical protein